MTQPATLGSHLFAGKAAGSSEMAGASRWLEAVARSGAGPRSTPTTTTASPMTSIPRAIAMRFIAAPLSLTPHLTGRIRARQEVVRTGTKQPVDSQAAAMRGQARGSPPLETVALA